RPMLATLADAPPSGAGWTFEVKWDGYRALAYVREGECQLLSRNENDLTERFADVARAIVRATKSPNAVLDGEVCALDERGRASSPARRRGTGTLVYSAFALLGLDGEPLVDLPLRERRARLRALLDGRSRAVRLSEGFEDGDALYAAAQE